MLHALPLLLAASTHAPPAWRALQAVPPRTFSERGKLAGTPPCLASLQKVGGGRKAAEWRLGQLEYQPLSQQPLDVNVKLDGNPVEPCCALTFVTASGSRVGRLLLACGEETSWLRGMEIRTELRGRGLSKLLLASWLRLCAVAGLTPRTRVINKPRLSLALARFGFVPVNERGQVVMVGGRDSGRPARSAYVRTDFALPEREHGCGASDGACASNVHRVLGDALQLEASVSAVRSALTLRGGGNGAPLAATESTSGLAQTRGHRRFARTPSLPSLLRARGGVSPYAHQRETPTWQVPLAGAAPPVLTPLAPPEEAAAARRRRSRLRL